MEEETTGQRLIDEFTEFLLRKVNRRFEMDEEDNECLRKLFKEQLPELATKSVETFNRHVENLNTVAEDTTTVIDEPEEQKKKIKLTLKKNIFKSPSSS